MHNNPKSDMFDEFAEDLLGERTARPLIIIGASKVDNLLLQILNVYLLPKTKAKEQDELLEGDKPLSTFSARIKICYRLGLIDKTLYLALEQLRALRNPSAHSIAFDIMKSPTREYIASLRKSIVSRHSFQETKKRYFDSASFSSIDELQCVLLTLCVLLELICEKVSTTCGIKIALSIATK